MTTPIIYIAHPLTGEYLGTGYADPDPQTPDGWLVPAHAYLDAPPTTAPGEVAVRADDAWRVLPDCRGTVYRTDTGAAVQHDQLGSLPEGLTTEPRPTAAHRWAAGSWIFDQSLEDAHLTALLYGLCSQIDHAADDARRAVAGDPLRAVEYDRAAAEALAFAAAGYQGEVPPMVAAWAIGGRTPQQAADSILAEAAQYNGALVQLRTVRLQAKELIRAAMVAGDVEQAQTIAAQTVASIEATVAGIGNNA